MAEAHPLLGEAIDPRGRVGVAPVAPDRLVADVIGKDEDDVRLVDALGLGGNGREQSNPQAGRESHGRP